MKYFLTFIICLLLYSNTYSQKLTGRYIMEGAGCAGFEFVNKKTVLWYNEVTCQYPDTLRIKWIDDKTFITISTLQYYQNCPPRVDVYTITKRDGKSITLKSFWTGWGKREDFILKLIKKN